MYFQYGYIDALTMGLICLPPRDGSMSPPFNVGRGLDYSPIDHSRTDACDLGPGHRKDTASWLSPLGFLSLDLSCYTVRKPKLAPAERPQGKKRRPPAISQYQLSGV